MADPVPAYPTPPQWLADLPIWLQHQNKIPHYSGSGRLQKRAGALDTHEERDRLVPFAKLVLAPGFLPGYALGPLPDGRTLVGIDFDHVVEAGHITSDAVKEFTRSVAAIGGMVETSMSGTGLHVVYVSKPDETPPTMKRDGLEVYSGGRFFALGRKIYYPGTDGSQDLRELLRPFTVRSVQPEQRAEPAPEIGERNNYLHAELVKLHKAGMQGDALRAAILGINSSLPDPLPESEVVNTILKSVGKLKAPVQAPASLVFDDVEIEQAPTLDASSLIVPYGQFIAERKAPQWIMADVFQRGYIYSLTARWGHGKTAVMLTVVMHIALGRALHGHQTQRSKVLYLAGENPDDVRLRAVQVARHFNMDEKDLDTHLHFSKRAFRLSAEDQAQKVAERVAHEGFDLVVVDTGIAHADFNEENSNTEMHAFARALRDFSHMLKGAGVVCLMHPPKDATRDTLSSRGGGAFAGEIDGELMMWQDASKKVELFAGTKMRGGGFLPMFFALQRQEIEDMVDNFGRWPSTVVAVETDEAVQSRADKLKGANKIAYQQLRDLAVDSFTVPLAVWRSAFYATRGDDEPDAKRQAFKRVRDALQAANLVEVRDENVTLVGLGPVTEDGAELFG